MRKLISEIAVTLDGFVEGTNGELDWVIFDKEMVDYANSFLKTLDIIFYGRKSFEVFGKPDAAPANSEGEALFSKTVNEMSKYVFSRTLKRAEGNTTIVSDKIADTVNTIKQQQGKDIWLCGGPDIIQTFLNLKLIDEFRLTIHPTILGSGKPLFANINNIIELQLLKAHAMNSGVVVVYYRPIRK